LGATKIAATADREKTAEAASTVKKVPPRLRLKKLTNV
jgi:hypothetical protein